MHFSFLVVALPSPQASATPSPSYFISSLSLYISKHTELAPVCMSTHESDFVFLTG